MRKKKPSKGLSLNQRKDFYGEYCEHGIKDFLGYSFEEYVKHFYLIPKQK